MRNRSGSEGQAILKTLLTLSLVGLVGLSGAFIFLNQGNREGEVRELLIPKGSSNTSVSSLLFKEGIVENPTIFKYVLRFTGGSQRVRAGEFRFRSQMSYWSALNVLYHDEPIVHQVTVPEGWTVRQIAQILASQRLVDPERFVSLAFHPTAPTRFKLNAPSLEGYLYPDTYTFSRLDGEEKILDRMVQHFFQKYDDTIKKRASEFGWSMEQVVTMASIIEKETGVPEERPLISSVFHNRLKKRMRLQSDPTTIYGIADFNGNLTKKHLQEKTPYNTYAIFGLPPGAIANPGYGSLHAALFPASSEFLFFVANRKGGHIFSKTYAEHLKHVNNYQIAPSKVGLNNGKN